LSELTRENYIIRKCFEDGNIFRLNLSESWVKQKAATFCIFSVASVPSTLHTLTHLRLSWITTSISAGRQSTDIRFAIQAMALPAVCVGINQKKNPRDLSSLQPICSDTLFNTSVVCMLLSASLLEFGRFSSGDCDTACCGGAITVGTSAHFQHSNCRTTSPMQPQRHPHSMHLNSATDCSLCQFPALSNRLFHGAKFEVQKADVEYCLVSIWVTRA
jgi:hypothetical protein